MENEFVPYEQALALKELGFDEPCLMYYDYSWTLVESGVYECKAPLYQQAFSFFRDNYGLDVTFRKIDYGPESQFTGYYFSVYRGNELIDIHGADKKCKVYKESEHECLKKLIEIVKEQKS